MIANAFDDATVWQLSRDARLADELTFTALDESTQLAVARYLATRFTSDLSRCSSCSRIAKKKRAAGIS